MVTLRDQSSVEDEVKRFLLSDEGDMLNRTAEDIGNYLGRARSKQVVQIFRLFDYQFRNVMDGKQDLEDLSSFLRLKARLVALIARSLPEERPALERFNYAFNEGLYCVVEASGIERYARLKRLHRFLEATICYQQYAHQAGSRFQMTTQESILRNKINQIQLEMNRLMQFVAASAEHVKVFLSHSRVDKPFVERLKKDLESQGIATWYDDKDLDIGDILSDAIAQGINQSWCFLIVVSPQSVKSKWVKYELDEAYDSHISQGKRILPILIGNLPDAKIPQRLKKHKYADFRNDSSYDRSFNMLHRALIRQGATVKKRRPAIGL